MNLFFSKTHTITKEIPYDKATLNLLTLAECNRNVADLIETMKELDPKSSTWAKDVKEMACILKAYNQVIKEKRSKKPTKK